MVPWLTKYGQPSTQTANGHSRRGHVLPLAPLPDDVAPSPLPVPTTGLIPDVVAAWPTRHQRARAIKGGDSTSPCEWAHLGHCTNRTHVAHVDQNDANNDPSNLKRLCTRHHALMDQGKMDPNNPVMPPFVVMNGKRWYEGHSRWQPWMTALAKAQRAISD